VIRVLVVDDHPAVRRAVREVLTDGLGDVAVGEAAAADDAVRLVAAEGWDLVLLDLALAGRPGLETLREIKRLRPGVPVLAMSMHPDGPYRAAACAAGAVGYVMKGSAPDVIVDAARAAMTSAEIGAAPAGPDERVDHTGSARLPAASGASLPAAVGDGDIEEERRRLATCLHDEVGQALAAAKISLGLAASAREPDEIHRHAAEASATVTQAIESLRQAVSRLRPPLLDELGLVPALRARLAELAAERGCAPLLLEAPPTLGRAPPATEIAAFRLVEAAVTTWLGRPHDGAGIRVTLGREGERLLVAISGPDGDAGLRDELRYPSPGGR